MVSGDLADFSLAPKVVDAAIKAFGKLDGMVLNHGVLGQVGKIAEADLQQWKQGLDINFLSFVAFVCIPRRGLQDAEVLIPSVWDRSKQVFPLFARPKERSSSRRPGLQWPLTEAGGSTGDPRPP